MGPNGPQWVPVGPNGSQWALMGPNGPQGVPMGPNVSRYVGFYGKVIFFMKKFKKVQKKLKMQKIESRASTHRGHTPKLFFSICYVAYRFDFFIFSKDFAQIFWRLRREKN